MQTIKKFQNGRKYYPSDSKQAILMLIKKREDKELTIVKIKFQPKRLSRLQPALLLTKRVLTSTSSSMVSAIASDVCLNLSSG